MTLLSELGYMGGYGFYVWPSYGIVTIGLLLCYLSAKRYEKSVLTKIKSTLTFSSND